MNAQAERIREYLSKFYQANEWPTLLWQAEEWSRTLPLEGLRVLDGTPLYRNTLGKLMALLAAGAEVWVPARPGMPSDPTVVSLLEGFGIHRAPRNMDDFDIILDCSGQFRELHPRLGFAELTRTGVHRHEHTHHPVILADSGNVGISISVHREEPFAKTLRLIPKILHLGIGCRKGTPKEAIREAVEAVLEAHSLDRRAIKCAASIDLKQEEPGLLEFFREWNLPVRFYTAEELRAVPGEFTPSGFVQSVTGVDNVCERSALMGAENLIVKKTAGNGVTVALAEEHWEVHFGETDRCGHWPR